MQHEQEQKQQQQQQQQQLEQQQPPPVVAQPSHPRDFADWKWKCTIAVIYLTSCINGKWNDRVVVGFEGGL